MYGRASSRYTTRLYQLARFSVPFCVITFCFLFEEYSRPRCRRLLFLFSLSLSRSLLFFSLAGKSHVDLAHLARPVLLSLLSFFCIVLFLLSFIVLPSGCDCQRREEPKNTKFMLGITFAQLFDVAKGVPERRKPTDALLLFPLRRRLTLEVREMRVNGN